MAFYNLTTAEGREALRADRQGELDAIRAGTWPRDLNDAMRWNPPRGLDPADHAARMCVVDLAYLRSKG